MQSSCSLKLTTTQTTTEHKDGVYVSKSWGWAEYEGLEQEPVQENECILGVWEKKAAAPA